MQLLDIINPEINPRKAFTIKPSSDDLIRAGWEMSVALIEGMSWKDKPVGIAYDLLKTTADRTPIISSIIQTRITQVGAFWKPARYSKGRRGFQIRLRNPTKQPTKEQAKMIEYLEAFVENCGDWEFTQKHRPKNYERDRFHSFLKKIVRDRLIYDQVNVEIMYNRKGKPVEFIPVDASTIRMKKSNDGVVEYYQVIGGQIVARFDNMEMVFAVANPRTDLEVAGYGYPEIERMIRIITSILYAEEYTMRFFQSGATPFGLFLLTGMGDISQTLIEKFQRMWAMQLTGILGSWKIPIIGLPEGTDFKFEPLSKPTDMPFTEWLTYLTNIACALYQISPDLINAPTKATLVAERDIATQLERRFIHSPDRGLYSLLDFIAEIINEYIIWQFDYNLEFEFVGVERLDIVTEQDLRIKAVDNYATLNEIRTELDLPPIQYGDVPLNSTYISHMERQKELELAKTQLPLKLSKNK